MSSITLELPEGDAELSDLSRRALAIYEERLKAVLEPEQNGKGLAIEPDSGDYEVAMNSTLAGRTLRRRHPGKLVVTMKVGLAPDYALAARYLAGLLQSGRATVRPTDGQEGA
jgi:hypothetical protein